MALDLIEYCVVNSLNLGLGHLYSKGLVNVDKIHKGVPGIRNIFAEVLST